jgi:hypothetical protein
MTKDEALRLALKAMKVNNSAWKHLADSGDAGYWEAEEQGYYQLNEKAIKAVEAALEAKDEPVAQGSIQHLKIMMEESAWEGRIELSDVLANIDEFYTTPPQQEAKDEPDYKALWQQMCERCDELDKKLAQRKPLTDEEIKSQWSVFWEADCHPWAIDFARAIEAKLKQKNFKE